MVSIEKLIKSQFERVFATSNWSLFKKVAESNLCEAAKLRKGDMPIESSLQLLALNSRKRLLIGVGVELLLKAIYLRQGYMINRPTKGSSLKFPFTAQEVAKVELDPNRTFMLNDLINSLPKVVKLQDKDLTLKGLKIVKVFRNKEGHGVTGHHTFDTSNYTDIASSLSALYRDAFGEKLSLRFSMAPNERAIWQITSPNKR